MTSGRAETSRSERGLPDAEIILLLGMVARAGAADGARLDRIEASLREQSKGPSRWQKLVACGVPAATARELRERWRSESALGPAIEQGLAGRPALERALGWHLLRTAAITPAALCTAIDRAATAALGRRKIGVQQLLVDAAELSPAQLCAAVADAGQSILVCADCGRANWQGKVEPSTMLLCEGCQGRLGPVRGDPGAELACPIGYDSLDAPIAALVRDGIAYGEPLATDASGAIFEAIGRPGQLLKRLAGRATADELKDLRKAANAARRLDCPTLSAPTAVEAADDGAYLAFELPPGRPLASLGGTFRESEALALVRDLARALAALHKAELCHGAMRPTVVWITDAGAARLLFAGETLQPGLDADAIPGARYRGGFAGREGDLHAVGALLVETQAGDVPVGPDAPALAAIPPRSAELARRCMGGAPGFAHAGELAIELATSVAEPRSRSVLTELSTTLGERANRASSAATTVRRADAAAGRSSAARRPSDGTPALSGADGAGRHRARTPSSASRQSPTSRTVPVPVLVGGVGAVVAIAAIALLLTRPGPRVPTTPPGTEPTPAPTAPVAVVPVSEEDKERLAVLLGRREIAEARALLARLTPAGELRARLVVEALLLTEPTAILALADTVDWPELAQSAATVAAQPGFRDSLRRDAERALAAGAPAVAQRLAAVAIRESGARGTWLLKALRELDLEQLARLRAEPGTADWPELERAIAARISSPEHRALVVQHARELVGAGSLEAAELALIAAVGAEVIDDATWDEVVRPLAADALSRAIDAAAALRRWDRLGRRAGRELSVRAPDVASTRARDAINAAIDLADANRHAEAVVRLNAYLAYRPDDYKGYGMRGNAYRLSGLEDLALADYQRTLELRPADPVALNNRAIIFRDRGQVELALSDHDLALSRNDDPDQRPGLVLNRSISLYLARQHDRTLTDTAELREFFGTAPLEARTRVQPYLDFIDAIEALVAADRGEKAAAASRLALALERNPGKLLSAPGPIRVMSELARRIAELLPDHPLPHVERHAVLLYYGRLDEAIAALEAALALATGPHAAFREAIEVELERARRAREQHKAGNH